MRAGPEQAQPETIGPLAQTGPGGLSSCAIILFQSALRGFPMDLYFLVGAILGSGLFIFTGREPARRLVKALQERRKR